MYNRDVMSANFRALFQLQYNQWAKHPKQAEQLWPLSIDDRYDEELTEDEMYARNAAIIAAYQNCQTQSIN